VPKLPEPPGAREGETGEGPSIKLLILGDSAAAGVGVSHQDKGLLGQIIERLSKDFNVQWVLDAKNGNTTSAMLHRLEALPPQHFDVAVTSLGVNDVTSMVSVGKWRRQQAELRKLLKQKFGVDMLIVSGLPPLHGFPALPQPLRWCLGARATQFNRDLESDVAGEAGAFFLDLRFSADTSLMATDGFHPGPEIYAEWGKRVAAVVSSN
jgi:lysophospholipase L1-like esterase